MIIFEERWNKLEYLGEGRYGKVYLVFDKILDKNIALKLFDIDIFNQYPASVLQELNVGFSIKNKHLIKYLFTKVIKYKHQYYFSVGIEHCLCDLVNYYSSRSINSDKIVNIVYEILLGLACLNNNNYSHNDLTLGNILIHKDGIKISDFGNAQHLLFDHLDHKIADAFNPPIVNIKEKEKSDIWSLGVIIYWLIFKKGVIMKKTQKEFIEYNFCYFPEWVSTKIKVILKDIFVFSPKDRPNAYTLLNKHFNIDIRTIKKEKQVKKLPKNYLEKVNDLNKMFCKEIILDKTVMWNSILLMQSNDLKLENIDYYFWISLTMLNKQKVTINSIKNKTWLIREVENLNKVLEKINYNLILLNHDIDGLEKEYNDFYSNQLNINFSYNVVKGLNLIMDEKSEVTSEYSSHVYDIFHYAKHRDVDLNLEDLIKKFD